MRKTLSTLSALVTGMALFSTATADEQIARYFVRPVTGSTEVENSYDKRKYAESIAIRMQNICGDRMSEDSQSSDGSVQLDVRYLKKVGGGSRFLLGPFRGNSNVALKLTILDKAGMPLLEKELHRRGNWFAGTVTFGATDAHMFQAVAQDICNAIESLGKAKAASEVDAGQRDTFRSGQS